MSGNGMGGGIGEYMGKKREKGRGVGSENVDGLTGCEPCGTGCLGLGIY